MTSGAGAWQMLAGVRSTEQGWSDNEIRYDGLASRAEIVDSTGTTRYAWDGIRVLKLEDEEGTPMSMIWPLGGL